MSDRRTLSSSLSAMVIQHLVDRGHSQAKIARMLGVSEAYVSLVRSRERALTLDHIERITERLQVPLGAFFMSVGPAPKNPSPRLKRLLKLADEVIVLADKAQEAIVNSVGARSAPKRSPANNPSRPTSARRRSRTLKPKASVR